MVMDVSFWRGRKVFLTGHTGFKGGWLSLWLQSLGADLTGFSLDPPTKPSLFEVANVERGMISIIGDVRDGAALAAAMQHAQPEIVIHMAAQPLVRRSYTDPVETYSTNVMGTVYLLEAVRKTPTVKAVVNVTSDKCYENKEWVWPYREDEPMGGHDPYSNSKGCAELVTAAYRNSFIQGSGVALASARAGNVIGGGDWASDRLVPDILRSFAQNQPVNIRNPNAIRPWQHVLEPLGGYLTLAERLFTQGEDFAQGWNFGPQADDAKPVQWIVEHMAKLWGEGARWQKDGSTQPHEANYLKLDISKAQALLGWRPTLSLMEALQLTVDWARHHAKGEDMKSITQHQIQQYQNRKLN